MPVTMRNIDNWRRCAMAKFHARPSLQYRYEHYDPRFMM
jgi:hypothetical protein